ncbi:hypothetical protein B5V02_30255 [Mesorhizobium kowhaii]|uniref:Uncharacterized protein n=1 Tax=Mesorhizobium kowhaii TaxID=1300272 RepID=A0A2W7CM93_9HYPH|nr:hypothetical protein B5V02_30255 [Mesorhizobium kowhaii]
MGGSYAPRLIIAQNRKAITFIQIGVPGEGSRVQDLTIGAAKANIDILRTRRHTPVAGVDFKQATRRKARASRQHLQAPDGYNPIAYESLGQTQWIGMIRAKV